MIRPIAAAIVAVGIALVAGPDASAQTAPVVAWVQWTSDGTAHARAISHTATCPNLTVGTTVTPMMLRSTPTPSFPDRVCDAQVPSNATSVSVGGVPLPVVPHVVNRIAIIGDNGCRTERAAIETCNDPSVWPFPAVVRSIVAAHPNIVIHLGDYIFRTSACPTGIHCAESDNTDNSASWNDDYFRPMQQLFAIAPIIHVRGAHETCQIDGWARYLSGLPDTKCADHEPNAYVRFDNLLIGNIDDTVEDVPNDPQPLGWITDVKAVQVRAANAQRETWLLANQPATTYMLTHENEPIAPDVDAYFAGNLHAFGAYSFSSEGALVMAGLGSNGFSSNDDLAMLTALGGVTERRFGYVLANRDAGGWTIEVHDVNGALHRSCRLAARKISCGAALTAAQ